MDEYSKEAAGFVTPVPLPTPHEAEILITLWEEFSEAGQRCAKILSFGRDDVQAGQTLTNSQRLAYELGDVQAMIHFAIEAGLVKATDISDGAVAKMHKFPLFQQHKK